MTQSVVCLLRKEEVTRDLDKRGMCHYLIEDWAEKAQVIGERPEDCLVEFQEPKVPYRFSDCTRMVVSLKLDGGRAALSIYVIEATSLLIHPSACGRATSDILKDHLPLMKRLTIVAMKNIMTLCNFRTPEKDWKYIFALEVNPRLSRNCSSVLLHPSAESVYGRQQSHHRDC